MTQCVCEDAAGLPRQFQDPITAVLWAGRLYLAHRVRPEPRLPSLVAAMFARDFHAPGGCEAVAGVFDALLQCSATPLPVCPPECTDVAPHEFAVANALRALAAGDDLGYFAAFAPFMSEWRAVRIWPQMLSLVQAMPTSPVAGAVH